MRMRDHVVLLARYNQWMNQKLYAAAATLPAEALRADRKAFFGSLLGTLNHIMVADTIWLQRFAAHPAQYRALDPVRTMATPTALDQTLFDEWAPLQAQRETLDAIILDWAASVDDADLDHTLEFRSMQGVANRRQFGGLVLHFFNHQTHHRGQATTLLTQAGLDVGSTDLVLLLPKETPG